MKCYIDAKGHVVNNAKNNELPYDYSRHNSLLLKHSCFFSITNNCIGLMSFSGERLVDSKYQSVSRILQPSNKCNFNSSCAFVFSNPVDNSDSCSIIFNGYCRYKIDGEIYGYNDDFVWQTNSYCTNPYVRILNYHNETLYSAREKVFYIFPKNDKKCLMIIEALYMGFDTQGRWKMDLDLLVLYSNGNKKKFDLGSDYQCRDGDILVEGKIPLYKQVGNKFSCYFVGEDGEITHSNVPNCEYVKFDDRGKTYFTRDYLNDPTRNTTFLLFSATGEELYKSEKQLDFYCDRCLIDGDKIISRQGKDTQYRLNNAYRYYPCYYDIFSTNGGLSHEDDDIIVENAEGKNVYLNESLKQSIPQAFDDARYFVNGFAAAKINNKWGVINKGGEWVIQPSFSDISIVSENLVAVKNDNKWGYSDLSGQIIIPCRYDDCLQFSNGLAAVNQDGRWGYIDSEGKIVIPFKYVEASVFENGYAVVDDGLEYRNINLKNNATEACFPIYLRQKGIPEINLQDYANFAIAKKGSTVVIQTTVPIAKSDVATIDIRIIKEDNVIKYFLILKIYGEKVLKSNFDVSFKSKSNDVLYCFSEEAESVYNDFSKNNIVRIEKQVELSIINKISRECKCLNLCYEQSVLSCPVEDFSERLLFLQYALNPNDTDISNSSLLKKQIQKSMPDEIKVNEESSDDKTDEKTDKKKTKKRDVPSLDKKIKEYESVIGITVDSNLDELYELISTPKNNKAYKELLTLTKDFDPPHPLVKLLSKIPNKSKLLADIKTVNENRQFKANHRLISSVFKRNTDLDPNTIKFINKIKKALK